MAREVKIELDGHGGPSIAGRLLEGAAAGFAGTVPMTIAMGVMHRALPRTERYSLPPKQITTRIARRIGLNRHLNEPKRTALTGAAHFGYGTAMGAAYAMVGRKLPLPPLLSGVVFAMVVWALGYMGWIPAMQIMPPASDQPRYRNALMIASHVVWGLAAGLVVDRLGRIGTRNSAAM